MTLSEYKSKLTYIFNRNTHRGFADWRQCGNLAYEVELSRLYPERCLAVLVSAADSSAKNGKNRRDYRYIAKYLKWMRKYPGGTEKAAALAEKYRQQYPRRSAMIDELRGI